MQDHNRNSVTVLSSVVRTQRTTLHLKMPRNTTVEGKKVAFRLEALKAMHAKGLLSAVEYEAACMAVLRPAMPPAKDDINAGNSASDAPRTFDWPGL